MAQSHLLFVSMVGFLPPTGEKLKNSHYAKAASYLPVAVWQFVLSSLSLGAVLPFTILGFSVKHLGRRPVYYRYRGWPLVSVLVHLAGIFIVRHRSPFGLSITAGLCR